MASLSESRALLCADESLRPFDGFVRVQIAEEVILAVHHFQAHLLTVGDRLDLLADIRHYVILCSRNYQHRHLDLAKLTRRMQPRLRYLLQMPFVTFAPADTPSIGIVYPAPSTEFTQQRLDHCAARLLLTPRSSHIE